MRGVCKQLFQGIASLNYHVYTISKSDLVGNGADFSNVRVKVALDSNVSDVEDGRENGAHLLKLLHESSNRWCIRDSASNACGWFESVVVALQACELTSYSLSISR